MKRTVDITMAMNSAMMLWFASDILKMKRFAVCWVRGCVRIIAHQRSKVM